MFQAILEISCFHLNFICCCKVCSGSHKCHNEQGATQCYQAFLVFNLKIIVGPCVSLGLSFKNSFSRSLSVSFFDTLQIHLSFPLLFSICLCFFLQTSLSIYLCLSLSLSLSLPCTPPKIFFYLFCFSFSVFILAFSFSPSVGLDPAESSGIIFLLLPETEMISCCVFLRMRDQVWRGSTTAGGGCSPAAAATASADQPTDVTAAHVRDWTHRKHVTPGADSTPGGTGRREVRMDCTQNKNAHVRRRRTRL